MYLPRSDQVLPDEPTRLALVSRRDFRGLKGIVEALARAAARAGAARSRVRSRSRSSTPGRAAELLLGDTHLGYLGEIDDNAAQGLRAATSLRAVELEFDVLLSRAKLVAQHRPLPPFPTVVRDLSLVVPRSLPWAELCDTVIQTAGPTLETVQYLDIFQGGNIPNDQQSVHFSMVFRHKERTLTGEEVERVGQER